MDIMLECSAYPNPVKVGEDISLMCPIEVKDAQALLTSFDGQTQATFHQVAGLDSKFLINTDYLFPGLYLLTILEGDKIINAYKIVLFDP